MSNRGLPSNKKKIVSKARNYTRASSANAASRGASKMDDQDEREDNQRGRELPQNPDMRLILSELKDFRRDNKTQLDAIKEEITKTNSRLDEAEGRVCDAEERLQNVEDIMAEMLKLQSQMDAKLLDAEGRSRRESIRIYGIRENAEKDATSMTEFVEKLLKENLDIPISMDLHIERAHRALGTQPPADKPPRSIVVKFLSYKTKDMVIRAAWGKKGFVWQEKQVNIDNDYAPRIVQMRKEYSEARKILKEKNISFRTLYPARLRVNYTDSDFEIYETVEEATQDMEKRGLPIRAIATPESMMEKLKRLTWQTAPVTRGRRGRSSRNNRSPHSDSRAAGYKARLQEYRRDPPSSD